MVILLLAWLLVVALLVGVSAISLSYESLSDFELRRRGEQREAAARTELRRRELKPYVESLQRIVTALLLIIMVALSAGRFGWFLGVVLAIIVAIVYGALGRLSFIVHSVQPLYDSFEPRLLNVIDTYQNILRPLRGVSPLIIPEPELVSREELEDLVTHSHGVLSADEKKLISASLRFDQRRVEEIMTPRGMISSISRRELLGPFVLDDLHKTGHSRFPVIDEDIDHIVGMLYVQDLLTLDGGKRSTTVEKAMEPHVYYIRQDQTLAHALAAFLRTHHHLFVVINEYRETVGLLSLEDVIEALIGRKIVDEFDAHDDLRAVAERNVPGNNQPAQHDDV